MLERALAPDDHVVIEGSKSGSMVTKNFANRTLGAVAIDGAGANLERDSEPRAIAAVRDLEDQAVAQAETARAGAEPKILGALVEP